MSEKLDGAVALVTGASSGIGEATARALAEHGAAVALMARRKERLAKLAAELGGKTLVLAGDVSDPAQAQNAVDETVKGLGRLDILINNAGIMSLGPVMDAPLEEWQKMVSVDIMGLLYMARASLPHLIKAAQQGRGVSDIVNISSVAGRIAFPNAAVYSMTKFGVTAFSEALRREVTQKHVRVSVVEPGAVETELADHLRPEIREEAMKAFTGFERLRSEDIADAIAYIVTRPRHVAVNETLIRPTEQEV